MALGAGLAVWAAALVAAPVAGYPSALDNPAGLAYSAVAALAYAAVAAVLLRRLPGLARVTLRDLGLRKPGQADLLVAVVAAVAVVGLRLATFAYLAAIGRPGHVQTGLGSFHFAGVAAAAATIVVATTIGPFSEELLFRGTIYNAIAARMPDERAAVASALVFAAARFDLVLAPFFVVYGTLLALVYRRTGNLFVPILIRAGFDGVSYALLLWLDVATR